MEASGTLDISVTFVVGIKLATESQKGMFISLKTETGLFLYSKTFGS